MEQKKYKHFAMVLAFTLSLQGCFQSTAVKSPLPQASLVGGSVVTDGAVSGASPSPGPSASISPSTILSGAKIARFILKSSNDSSGSFPEAPASGTTTGSGFQASRVFNADGSILATGPENEGWPKWIPRFEVGLSGDSNSNAKSPDCARFANAEDESSSCGSVPCGAPSGYYRVSEFDCARSEFGHESISTNGIFIRAQINRNPSILAPNENIMMAIEYSAAGAKKGAKDPKSCAKAGFSDPLCSEYLWSLFLMKDPGEAVSPFSMVVPPVLQYFSETLASTQGSSPVATKQVLIPLSSYPSAQWIHLGRVFGPSEVPAICLGKNSGMGLSPLCSGVIYYSITFYRM